jgi:hypothetical protein
MRLLKQLKVLPSQKLSNISKMFSDTEDAFLTQNIMEVSAEPVKLLSSEKLLEDGPKNQSKSFWDLLITLNLTRTLKTSKTLRLITFKLIELLRDVEEHTEPMVESVPIFLHKLTFKFLLLKRQLT